MCRSTAHKDPTNYVFKKQIQFLTFSLHTALEDSYCKKDSRGPVWTTLICLFYVKRQSEDSSIFKGLHTSVPSVFHEGENRNILLPLFLSELYF